MKKYKLLFRLLFIIGLMSTNAIFAQDWYQQQSGTSSAIRGVYFNDVNTGTVTTSNGSIIRTTDGGNHWAMQISGTSLNLFDVYFTDANTGFVVGNNGTILQTTNAGMAWTQQSTGTTKQFNKVFFIDPLHGTIAGNSGTIYQTSNGGITWSSKQVGTNHFKGLHLINQLVGMVVGSGGTIYRTTNGGVTWIQQSCELPKAEAQNSLMCTPPDLEGVFFTDINTGTIVGSSGKIYHTVNGGINWTEQTSGTSSTLHNVFFTDGNMGTAVGDSGIIIHTTNGGVSWYRQISGTKNALFDVFFANAMVGTAVGANGTILRTVPGLVPCPIINLQSSMLDSGIVNVQYQRNLIANGGSQPYSFSISSGVLPSGILLSPDGILSGTPIISGVFSFSVTVKDVNGCSGFQNYSLVIAAPQFSISPNESSFGDVKIGSNMQNSFIITNAGNSLLVVSSLSSNNSQFSLDETGFNLLSGESKNITVSFAPIATGMASGTITIVHNASMSPSTVHVSGTGVAPLFSLSTTNINFGEVLVGSNKIDTIIVTNTGNATLTVSSVSSDLSVFVVSVTSLSIEPGVSKKLEINFHPLNIGTVSGNIIFVHDGINSPAVITVSGVGIAPAFSISQSAKSFGDVLVGSSKVDSVDVKNNGTALLTIFSVISNKNEFTVIPTNAALSVGETQRFVISFHPETNGAISGTIIFYHSALDSASSIMVNGIGVSPGFFVTPKDIAFGDLLVDSDKKDSTVVTNIGTAPLTINSVVSSENDFTVVPQNAIIAPGSRQAFSVSFKPTMASAYNAHLLFTYDAAGSSGTVNLTGNGVVPGFTMSPSIIIFGNVLVGSSSQQILTVKNTGSYDLSISSASCDNVQFGISPLSTILMPGAEQIFTVTFHPNTVGTQSGTITFVHNASQSPATIPFYGNGVVPGFSAVPTILSFDSVIVGSTKTDSVIVTNSGLSPLTISSVTSDNIYFAITSEIVSLQTGESHIFHITFNPMANGLQSGNIIFNYDVSGSPGRVGVTGIGIAPVLWVAQSHISFGDVELGSSKEERIYLRNVGSSALTIFSIEVKDSVFSTSTIPISIPTGTGQKLSIYFSPKSAGATNGTIIVSHNGLSSPDTIIVSGVGVYAEFSVSPTELFFGNVPVGASKKDSVLVVNHGTSILTITSAFSSDPQFSVSPIKAGIVPGGSVLFYVTFRPMQGGSISGNINFNHNGLISSSQVGVHGSGENPGFIITQHLAFGNVVRGTSKVDSVIVKNTGNYLMSIYSVVTNNPEFSITPTSGTLASLDTMKFYITFSPSELGVINGIITFNHDAPGSPNTLLVVGTGVAPGFAVTPKLIGFGEIPIGTEKETDIIVTNTGTSLLAISEINCDNAEFSIFPVKAWIPPLGYQVFRVSYSSHTVGEQNGRMVFVHNASPTPDTVLMAGTGTIKITILHYKDCDNNPNTTYDLIPKPWHIFLYRESVRDENLVASVNGFQLQATVSRGGVYIASIADSGSLWKRINGNHTRFDTLEVRVSATMIDTFIQFRPNSIVITQYQDEDGNFATSDDRTEKKWYFEIHLGSVFGPMVAAGNVFSLEANDLGDGSYYAIQADSAEWVNLGYTINGIVVPGEVRIVTITLSGGESASVEFINAPPQYGRVYRSFTPEEVGQKTPVLKRVIATKFCARFINTTGKTVNGLEFSVAWYPWFNPTMTKYSPFTNAYYDGSKKWVFRDGNVRPGDTVNISGISYTSKPMHIFRWDWMIDGVSQGVNKEFIPTDQISLLPLPNYANLRNDLFRIKVFGLKGLVVGIPKDSKLKSRYGWVELKSSSLVQFSLAGRFGIHTQAAHGFDKLNNGKPFIGVKNQLPPSVQNNELFANMVALRFGITASAACRTPIGFGELIFDDGTGQSHNQFNGMMVKEIACYADSLMMGYYEGSIHKFANPTLFVVLNQTIQKINEAFTGQIDTVSFGTQLVFKGTKRLVDVNVLHPNPGVVPERIIVSPSNLLTQEDVENQDDQIVEDNAEIPTEYQLEQNYPNPFNPVTTIRFAVPEVSEVTLIAYNMLGQEVVRIFDGMIMNAGQHEIEFDGSNFSSGVYVYRIIAHQITESSTAVLAGDINKVKNATQQEFTSTRKMMLVK